jgi:hypothetical protein
MLNAPRLLPLRVALSALIWIRAPEAMIVNGKVRMHFGPFPAFLRIALNLIYPTRREAWSGKGHSCRSWCARRGAPTARDKGIAATPMETARLARNFVYRRPWNVNMPRCCAVKTSLISRGSALFHLPRNHRDALQITFWCINAIFRLWLERV